MELLAQQNYGHRHIHTGLRSYEQRKQQHCTPASYYQSTTLVAMYNHCSNETIVHATDDINKMLH